MISDWNAKVTEPAIALRRRVESGNGSMAEVVALVNKQEGKKYFDAFRGKIAEFSGIEAKLMRERQATADKANTQVTANLDIMRKNEGHPHL